MSTATKEAQRPQVDPAQYRPGGTITQWTPEDLFIVFYATCLAVCWWFYARKGAEAPS
ncbi:hypothetical protein ACFWUW_06485 [Streptomyces sp. NPDC058655]|uniref:hypothetical protein n=1 Tax=unclassified Streptomyces TaxID=2593676 RepID=UPI003650127B